MTNRRYIETQVKAGDHGYGVKDTKGRKPLVGPDGNPIKTHSEAFVRYTSMTQRDAHDLAMEFNG